MSTILYEVEDNVYRIDDVAQRFLVFLEIHGNPILDDAKNPVGAEDISTLKSRISHHLGPRAAGLVEQADSQQMTLNGEEAPLRYSLTEKGESVVYEYLDTLAMPTDLTELAETVARLRVDQREAIEIQDRVDELEERLTELEDQI